MKNLLFTTFLIFLFALTAHTQTAECPPDFVCLTKTEAVEALKAVDERNALKNELQVKDKAIVDLKDEITRLKIELARITGEKIGSDAMAIQQRAIIEQLLKMVRKKKIGIVNIL